MLAKFLAAMPLAGIEVVAMAVREAVGGAN
jgi:hypothetical protein